MSQGFVRVGVVIFRTILICESFPFTPHQSSLSECNLVKYNLVNTSPASALGWLPPFVCTQPPLTFTGRTKLGGHFSCLVLFETEAQSYDTVIIAARRGNLPAEEGEKLERNEMKTWSFMTERER